MLKTASQSLVKTARNINTAQLTADALIKKYASRKRVGKTARDKARKEKDGTAA